jgi:hypothetical protein
MRQNSLSPACGSQNFLLSCLETTPCAFGKNLFVEPLTVIAGLDAFRALI